MEHNTQCCTNGTRGLFQFIDSVLTSPSLRHFLCFLILWCLIFPSTIRTFPLYQPACQYLIFFTLWTISHCPKLGPIQTLITAVRKITILVLLKRGARHLTEGIRFGHGRCRNAAVLMEISLGVQKKIS
jgi:hypothetical protein